METKQLPFAATETDLEQGIIAGYAAIMGNVDDGNDVIHLGAFAKTLKERGDRVRVTWQHDQREPIGKPLLIEEHGREQLPEKVLKRAPDAVGGLFTKSKISETRRGHDALVLFADEVVDELSIGFDAVKADHENAVRHLRELRLWEYAPVTWGMNAAAVMIKSVVPFQDLPLADEARPWDRAAADKRVRAWAGGGADVADMSWSKYRRAFVWYDQENPEQVGSYKLQVGDIIDGQLMAVPRGIFAVAVVLQGGRGGVAIPEGDQASAKGHIARYYKKMDREPPWQRQESAAIVDLGNGYGLSYNLAVLLEPLLSMEKDRELGQADKANVEEANRQMAEAIDTLNEMLKAAEPPQDSGDVALTVSKIESRLRELELRTMELELVRQ